MITAKHMIMTSGRNIMAGETTELGRETEARLVASGFAVRAVRLVDEETQPAPSQTKPTITVGPDSEAGPEPEQTCPNALKGVGKTKTK